MSPTVIPNPKRDQRLDFLRGIALVTIFVNHVPGTVFENFTSRNFGFSDAAEAFVLMSGIAAALAYTKATKSSIGEGFLKSSARALKLYWVHLLITVLALVSVVWISAAVGNDDMLGRNNMDAVFRDPWTAALGIVTFGHQFGYFNILPLYCVLMLAAPLMIAAALRAPRLFLAASAAVWLAAGSTRTNFPNFPTDGGWFLDPLSWQLVFAVGVVVGVSKKEGRAFCAFHPAAFAAAAAYLVIACAVVQFSLWNHILLPSMPEVLFGFNKMYVTLPRLLHVLALAYVLIHMSSVASAANADWSRPLRFLGSNSLSVFATGSVLCIALQTVMNAYPPTVIEGFIILAFGLGAQFVAAGCDDVSSVIRTKVAMAGHATRAG
ncbi:OpgC domain-containing protein [Pararhizobium sp. BT-229]|uniref:OpgC family protein n=1 Tax=Pararhizobium sp. BT-229 TaxID=2986923 RepID=UPI0021F6B970|nr:OpgC domain-containing protein [Pararhizobium sp. BT-229]MCV9964468.1 OpgC domain-containing protein [Pararhizobium sp. BT-229]